MFQNQGTVVVDSGFSHEIDYGGSVQYQKGGRSRFMPNLQKAYAIVSDEEFPDSSGIQRVTGEYFAQYYKDIGILRGKSICKYPNR